MLLNALSVKETKQPQDKEPKPWGAPKHLFSIGVENEGMAHIRGVPEAARLIGCAPNTLSTKLSLGGGKYHFTRNSPDTGNPVDCVVLRGAVGVHRDSVVAWLEQTNHKLKAAAPSALPPLRHDEQGMVISRMKGVKPGGRYMD
jgi:hypothetical protein